MPSSSQRSYASRGDYANDNRGRRMPERDEEGRFVSEEDEDRDYGSRRSGGRRSASSGRGHGGWFGDPEGHSQAARRGWDEEDEYRSRPRRRESRRYEEENEDYSRSRSASRGRSHGGWFGDPEGHAEASRRGWENSDHGDSGWFGDPEGHSEAAERGWEHGHRGQRSSSRRDYDEDRYSRRRSSNW